MKQTNFFRLLLFFSIFMMTISSCNDNNNSVGGEESYEFGVDDGNTSCNQIRFDEHGKEDNNGSYLGNGEQNFVLKGNISLPKGTYVLKGWVYIGAGSTLTLAPGTIIKGDKITKAALIVERGGKLIAQGRADSPIVFTSNQPKGSRKPGDWGGLIICGNAPNNQKNEQQIEGGPRSKHGGTDVNDNSGVLSYVRVEFAGYPFQVDKEINGVTFGSIGKGTKIDHIQVSYSNDDSFEWFGGTVNCKYLIAYKGWDDDFDTDNGYSGNVQFGLVIRDSKIADLSQSNGFESDNCGDGALAEPFTTARFSNITFIGPMVDKNFKNDNSFINGGDYNPNNGSSLGKFQAAMQVRRSSRLNCFNSVAIGFPIGLIIDGEKGNSVNIAKEEVLKLQNIWFAEMGITGSDANKIYDDVEYDAVNKQVINANVKSYSTRFFLSQKGNAIKNLSELNLIDSNGIGSNYMPQVGSPMLNAASFDNITGFDIVSYIGAFNSNDNWINTWTNFDPNNTDY